jgi:phage terminase small subunit
MGKRGPRSAIDLATFRPNRSISTSKPAPDLSPPPAHLQPSTQAWWLDIVASYEFQQHDLRTLQAAAEAWDRCQQARLALVEHGLTYEDPKGMVRARPEIAIERDSRTSYLRALRELKLEPPQPPRPPYPWEPKRGG